MTQAQDSLARLTLRQLRLKASDLGVPLYSRKSKAALVKEISRRQEAKNTKNQLLTPFWRAPNKSPDADNKDKYTRGQSKVVFLPRDPEWAYVFW